MSRQPRILTDCSVSEVLAVIAEGEPVVFRGMIADWPSLKWTPESLKHIFGDVKTKVRLTNLQKYDVNTSTEVIWEGLCEHEEVSIGEFVDWLSWYDDRTHTKHSPDHTQQKEYKQKSGLEQATTVPALGTRNALSVYSPAECSGYLAYQHFESLFATSPDKNHNNTEAYNTSSETEQQQTQEQETLSQLFQIAMEASNWRTFGFGLGAEKSDSVHGGINRAETKESAMDSLPVLWIGGPRAHTSCHYVHPSLFCTMYTHTRRLIMILCQATYTLFITPSFLWTCLYIYISQDSYGQNFVAQLYGHKKWTLFPPHATPYLYPTRVSASQLLFTSHVSRALTIFPLFVSIIFHFNILFPVLLYIHNESQIIIPRSTCTRGVTVIPMYMNIHASLCTGTL